MPETGAPDHVRRDCGCGPQLARPPAPGRRSHAGARRPLEAASLADVYDALLRVDDEDASAVLAVLAAAGAGPVLPVVTLADASAALGGAATVAAAGDVLVSLGG